MKKKFKPFFKWSGGKSREFDKVAKWMPKEFETFYEPFLGGGAVWLGLAHEPSVVGDFYDEVTNFFQVLKDHGQTFVDECNEISKDYNNKFKNNVVGAHDALISEKEKAVKDYKKDKDKEALKSDAVFIKLKKELKDARAKGKKEYEDNSNIFYDWRKKHTATGVEKAKRFFVLRCLAYGGMLRFNAKGEFNVPYGFYKSFKSLDYPEGIESLLSNTTIHNQSWEKTVATAGENDFVFFDPPYTREFTEYSSGNDFGKEQHIALAEYFKSKKSKCMIIINKDDFTYDLYKDYIKEEYDFTYSVKYRDRLSKDEASTLHFVATNY
jgi:DNA adenine methylase